MNMLRAKMKIGRKDSSAVQNVENWYYHSVFDSVTDGLIIIDLEDGCVVDANPAACAMHGQTREEFIGLIPKDFIHPGSLHLFREYLQEFRSGRIFDTQALHLHRNSSTFHVEWRGTAFSFRDHPCLLGVLRDVSKRIQAEENLQDRIDTRTREQATLLEISHTLASTLELQPGLILDQLREIIEYTHAALFGLTDSTLTALAVRSGPGSVDQTNGLKKLKELVPFQIRVDGPEILATLFNGHQPLIIPDICSSNPEADFLRSLLTREAAFLLEDACSWMWVPLAVQGQVIGGLGVSHTLRNHFTVHHANLTLSMADQVAITMVNAELYEQARTLATLQERQRLARNLHDAVNQSLFSAGLIAEVLPRLWERNPDEARNSLEDLRRLTRGALAEMRELLAELRPSVLTDSSLGDLLHQLANAFTGRTNITVSVKSAGEHILPPQIQVAFYRICQEALNNIAKHAGASNVDINMHYETGVSPQSGKQETASPIKFTGFPQAAVITSAEMSIHDDGHGFDTEKMAMPGHYGLGMMRERAEDVGAHIIFTSQPGHGSTVSVRWSQEAT
jgi:two-component system nitrate/nitrite sensor histidine kinase NarX